MSQQPVYGLLYIVLLPFALLFGLSALSNLLLAAQMPMLLIFAFLAACYTIYTVATLIFYIKGIQQKKPCNPSLRDWIRVNAFVIMVPSFLFFVNVVALIAKPALIQNVMTQLDEMQEGSGAKLSPGFVKAVLYVLAVYMGVLLLHIFYTFRLLKKYRSLFGYTNAEGTE